MEIKEPEQMIVDLPWLKERLSKAKKGRKKIKSKTANTSNMEESVEGPGPAPSTKRARDDDESSSGRASPAKVARPPDTVRMQVNEVPHPLKNHLTTRSGRRT